jgi:hypothetical protein
MELFTLKGNIVLKPIARSTIPSPHLNKSDVRKSELGRPGID